MNLLNVIRYDIRWHFIIKNEQHQPNNSLLIKPIIINKKQIHNKIIKAQISSENQYQQQQATSHQNNNLIIPKEKQLKLNQNSNLIENNQNEAYIKYLKLIISKSEKECIKLLEKSCDWWREVGSIKNGRRSIQVSDFDTDKTEEVFRYLIEKGIAVKYIPSIIESCPEVLFAHIETEIKPLIAFFENLPIQREYLGYIIYKCPCLIMRGHEDQIQMIFEILNRIGIHRNDIQRVLCKCPELIMMDIHHLKTNTNNLTDLILKEKDILYYLERHPTILYHPNITFNRIYGALRTIGMTEEDTRACIKKEPKLLIKKEMQLRNIIKLLASHGLSSTELIKLFKKYPKILTRKSELIEEKTRFLLEIGGFQMRDIVEFPEYYNYSVSMRIGPRLVFLKSKYPNKLKKLSLQKILNCQDKRFLMRINDVLPEEYLIFKTQWTELYGKNFNFFGPIKKSSHLDYLY